MLEPEISALADVLQAIGIEDAHPDDRAIAISTAMQIRERLREYGFDIVSNDSTSTKHGPG